MSKNKVTNLFIKYAECIAFILLIAWCVLPFIRLCFDFIMGLAGAFPSSEYMSELGFYKGGYYYMVSLDFYRILFRVLGVITLLYSVFSLILCRFKIVKRDNVKNNPWFYLLLALLIWAVISSIVSNDFGLAFAGEYYLNDGLYSYFIYAGVFICASMIKAERYKKLILQIFVSVVSLLAIVMIIQEFDIAFLNYCFPAEHAVVFNQFNHFGYVLCMGMLAFLGLFLYSNEEKVIVKVLYILGFSLLSYALVLNNTFGAYLATLIAIPIILIFYKISGRKFSKLVFIPIVIFVLISVINILGLAQGDNSLQKNLIQFGTDIGNIVEKSEEANNAGTGRFILWKDTLERIGQRPIFGFGPMGFRGEFAITNGDSTHNEYLQLAGFLGIPALVMYLGALIILLINRLKRIKELSTLTLAASGAAVGYLISAFFGNPVFNTFPFFWIFLGLVTSANEGEQPLFLPREEDLAGFESKIDKKRVVIILVCGVVIIGAVIGVSGILNKRNEKEWEIADLQAMRCAEVTAQSILRNSAPNQGEAYWFDMNGYKLIPVSGEKPEPYGLGTKQRGNALGEFNLQYGTSYDYAETTDYRDKIILVRINSSSGKNGITLEWVE